MAELHRRVDEGDAGEGEERAGVQPPGAAPVGLDGADHGPVRVAHGHALGAPGRPRRVEDVGQVLGLTRGTWKGERSPAVASVHARTELSGGGVPSSAPASIRATRRPAPVSPSLRSRSPSATTARGARVLEHVGHLGRGQAWVHRDGHAAGPVGGRVRDEPAQGELGTQVDADAGAGLEAGLERGGGPWRWPRRPTRRRSWTRRRRRRRPSGRRTPRPCGPGDRPSALLKGPPGGRSES